MGSQVSTSKTTEENLQEMLELHNKYRAAHGVPPLELDTQLNTHAQEWADELQSWGRLEPSTSVIGENCFLSGTRHLIAAHAVNVWYSEKVSFDWDRDYEDQPETEHFTQIIWRSSKKMGGGYKTGSSGTYIVAVYVPPGNIPGHFKDNIYPVIPAAERENSIPKPMGMSYATRTFRQFNRRVLGKNTSKADANPIVVPGPVTAVRAGPHHPKYRQSMTFSSQPKRKKSQINRVVLSPAVVRPSTSSVLKEMKASISKPDPELANVNYAGGRIGPRPKQLATVPRANYKL